MRQNTMSRGSASLTGSRNLFHYAVTQRQVSNNWAYSRGAFDGCYIYFTAKNVSSSHDSVEISFCPLCASSSMGSFGCCIVEINQGTKLFIQLGQSPDFELLISLDINGRILLPDGVGRYDAIYYFHPRPALEAAFMGCRLHY
ncbi:unnamed protein product [Protopolystoma xenopodis]|uniref:Uncharacterized protein n=1 Tax=Protopolystoma xenopodis TaxID=117903 RepID=A0A3S5AMJ4_9PLAT|nr:unnamed protein product [Protopolystoma xenopodis]